MTSSRTSPPPPAPPASLGDVEHEITRFLRRARTASQAMATEVHPDLDAAGYSVLGCVLELSGTMPEGVRAADVGSALGLHKSTTSRNIGEFERLGLIERVPDLSDARARLLRAHPVRVRERHPLPRRPARPRRREAVPLAPARRARAGPPARPAERRPELTLPLRHPSG